METSIEIFRKLPMDGKCDIINRYARSIMTRTLREVIVCLYHYDNFFVEVFYNPKDDRILFINAFQGLLPLTPYLEDISLRDLDRSLI